MEKEKTKSSIFQNFWNAAVDLWAAFLAIGSAIVSAINIALQWLSQGYIKSGWVLPVELLLTLLFTVIAIIKAIRKQRKVEKELKDKIKELEDVKLASVGAKVSNSQVNQPGILIVSENFSNLGNIKSYC